MNTEPIIIRSFDKPTNIYIIGNKICEDVKSDFSLCKDGCLFWLKLNNRIIECSSFKDVYILTENEYDEIEGSILNEDNTIILVNDYIGDIGLKTINEFHHDEVDYRINMEIINKSYNYIPENFNHNDYINNFSNNQNTQTYLELNCYFSDIQILMYDYAN